MSGEYQRAIRAAVPGAEICFDPFHVVRLGARATDQVRRDEWNAHDRSHTPHGRWVKSTRWSLLKAPEHQSVRQLAKLHEVSQVNQRLYRAFLLRGGDVLVGPNLRMDLALHGGVFRRHAKASQPIGCSTEYPMARFTRATTSPMV